MHLLHTMGDTFALMRTLQNRQVRRAVIVGAGYVGLEMAEALTTCGLAVTQVEQLPEVLPTVDPELGALVRAELHRHDVNVQCNTRVDAIEKTLPGSPHPLEVKATDPDERPLRLPADVVLVSVGVRPDTELAAAAGAELGVRGAIAVDRQMRTNLPDVLAAGDCVTTYHRLLGTTYLPLGTTAHKQGRIAGENALGGTREFAGSLGTQVVKVFDLVAARTGLRDHEATARRLRPGNGRLRSRRPQGLLPRQPQDRDALHRRPARPACSSASNSSAASAPRSPNASTSPATAIFNGMTVDGISDLDLSYTPPLGSPWDALQTGAQTWQRLVDPLPFTAA